MFQIDLTSLRTAELRGLLDSARARGQAALSYEILQEMAARRQGAAPATGRRGLFGSRRRGAEPRVIALDLDDPLEHGDGPDEEIDQEPPAWQPPPYPFTLQPDPAPAGEPDRDLRLATGQATAPPPPTRVRRSSWLGAGFAAGLVAGVTLGWWAHAGGLEPGRGAPPRAAQTRQLSIATAERLPEPAAAIAAAEAPQDAPPVQVPPVQPIAPPAPEIQAPAPPEPPLAEAIAPPAVAVAEAPTPAADPDSNRCAAQATPADRTICGDPRLRDLQTELRRAYARALAAHEDRDLLRQRQLAWRNARNGVGDPEALARLYKQRIRKLDDATADALRRR